MSYVAPPVADAGEGFAATFRLSPKHTESRRVAPRERGAQTGLHYGARPAIDCANWQKFCPAHDVGAACQRFMPWRRLRERGERLRKNPFSIN